MPGHSCNLVLTSQYSCLMLRVRDQAPRFKGSAAGTSYGEGGGGGGKGVPSTNIDGNFASAPMPTPA